MGRSTKGEGIERRYFYGAVWSITFSQTLMLILWKTLPKNHTTDIVKLVPSSFTGWIGVCLCVWIAATNAAYFAGRSDGGRLISVIALWALAGLLCAGLLLEQFGRLSMRSGIRRPVSGVRSRRRQVHVYQRGADYGIRRWFSKPASAAAA